MWRLSAFLFFLLLIAATGQRESWKQAAQETRAIIRTHTAGLTRQWAVFDAISPGSAREAMGQESERQESESRESESRVSESQAYEGQRSQGDGSAPAVAENASQIGAPPGAPQGVKEGREGRLPEETFETRDAASHIPLLARAAEMENVAAAPDGRIAAQVQNELKRLGCYDGSADNVWGGASARAVRKISRRAGLNLRSTKPTAELLAALKGVAEPGCEPQRRADGKEQQEAQSAKRQDRLPGQISPGPAAAEAGASGGAQNGNSYLPPWMQNSQVANAEPEPEPARDEPAERAEEPRRHPQAVKKISSPRIVRNIAPRPHREWRPRQRRRPEHSSHSWFPFFN